MVQRTAPKVETFPSDVSVEEVVAALKIAGGCIIKSLVSEADVKQIDKDLRPYFDADVAWDGNFFAPETRRAYGMVGKSFTAASKVVMNPLYQAVCDTFLKETYSNWSGRERMTGISYPQLNNSVGLSIKPGPGARDQPLHRDDITHNRIHPEVNVYPPMDVRRESAVGFLVAGKRTTKENGATRFIPGSHLWGHECPPDESFVVYAELEPGDGLIVLASAFHGGSANRTMDEERLVYSCFMTRGYMRQEENQYLTLPREVVKEWPIDMQKLVGYSLSGETCGWVASKDPRSVLDPNMATLSF